MRRFFENKLAFLAVSSLFTVAFFWNLGHGSTGFPTGHGRLLPENLINTAHGATLPPDPWEGNLLLAHGATLPPDPWEGNLLLAHGATLPPDPWEGNLRIAHGATLPPDPWEGNLRVAMLTA